MRHVVGIADMKIALEPGDEIVTYALGSCLGISIYDPASHVGGMLHVMLPLSIIDPRKAALNPAMFVDTGVPRLFQEAYKAGAVKQRLIVKVAGGASSHDREEDDHFQIGKRNFIMLRRLLWKNGVMLHAHDTGAMQSRTMSLVIGTGEVTVKSNGAVKTL